MDPNSGSGESLNVARGPRIPGRSVRIAVVVGLAAVAGLVTGGVVLVTRDARNGSGGAAAPPKPLTGTPPLVINRAAVFT